MQSGQFVYLPGGWGTWSKLDLAALPHTTLMPSIELLGTRVAPALDEASAVADNRAEAALFVHRIAVIRPGSEAGARAGA
jgi:hypothetical protein